MLEEEEGCSLGRVWRHFGIAVGIDGNSRDRVKVIITINIRRIVRTLFLTYFRESAESASTEVTRRRLARRKNPSRIIDDAKMPLETQEMRHPNIVLPDHRRYVNGMPPVPLE